MKAEKELETYNFNNIPMNPDRYYELMLTITGDKKKARNAQAALMLAQMAN